MTSRDRKPNPELVEKLDDSIEESISLERNRRAAGLITGFRIVEERARPTMMQRLGRTLLGRDTNLGYSFEKDVVRDLGYKPHLSKWAEIFESPLLLPNETEKATFGYRIRSVHAQTNYVGGMNSEEWERTGKFRFRGIEIVESAKPNDTDEATGVSHPIMYLKPAETGALPQLFKGADPWILEPYDPVEPGTEEWDEGVDFASELLRELD